MRPNRLLTAMALTAATPAHAAVNAASPSGFVVTETARVAAPPGRAYATLRDIGHWWSSAHSFSGNALNLRLELKQGGCFCEMLPAGGFVEHMRVVYADPGKAVILHGALGPLLDQGLSGAMKIAFAPDGTGTRMTLTYAVGGFFSDTKINWPAAVDHVLGEQLARLASLIDTGHAEPPKAK